MKTNECKDGRLFPAQLQPSNDTEHTPKYYFYLPSHTLLSYLYPSTSIMCFQTIPVLSQPRSKKTRRRQRNPANLHPIATSSTTPLSFSVGLWNCQSAVNKTDVISAFSLQSTLSILGLTETWIRPEDSATPAALSHNFSFSHTPRQVGRGGGTGLLISNNWKCSTHSPLGNHNSFESHAITVTAPIKTPDSSNLPSPWPNSSHLPRGAGRPAVLFHGGWHSTLSLWRFQHSPRQALCYRLPFTPSLI